MTDAPARPKSMREEVRDGDCPCCFDIPNSGKTRGVSEPCNICPERPKRIKSSVAALMEENTRLREALEKADEALQTWTALYAPTECTEQNVAQAMARVSEGGTLWYIANVNQSIRQALARYDRETG